MRRSRVNVSMATLAGVCVVKNAATNALRAGRCIQLNIPHVGPGLIYDVKW